MNNLLPSQLPPPPTGSGLTEDFELLRACEDNLRQYEARLRAFQAELDRDGAHLGARRFSSSPFAGPAPAAAPDEAALQQAWEKLYRARALLETEQGHLRDDRLALREEREALDRRERDVAYRELRAAEAALVTAPVLAPEPVTSVARLTRAPFAMARSVFGSKK